jgi:glycosyltransferase involved in cell wall biosynthesis
MKIGIVIPAHNEAETIAQCLASVQIAIEQLPPTVQASSLVVLDSCTDATLSIIKSVGIEYLCCHSQCVGQVRDIGIRHAIVNGATWLACTDADSSVSADWLLQQIEHIRHQKTDMICGVVTVDNWSHLSLHTKKAYMAHYQDKMGHRHVHGANLSFSKEAYLAIGGFAALACHEDVDLVNRFEAQCYAITWSNRVRVSTSSRLQARAKEGFGAFLANLETVS